VTGPDHYRAAEKITTSLADGSTGGTKDQVAAMIALAQVHATLALTAATIDAPFIADRLRDGRDSDEDERDWYAATS
jgi:hypothetical protein